MDYKINTQQENNKYFVFDNLKSCKYNIGLELSGDAHNCKLSYIHQAGTLEYVKDNNECIDIINAILGKAKGMVIINTTSKRISDLIVNNYQVYYKHNVPIGYNNNFQYHIGIRNHIKVNDYCKIPIKKPESIEKAQIKNALLELLKSKKRKADYVDEFIDSINI
jgi:hypothetical protein